MLKSQKFLNAFSRLGTSWDYDEATFKSLEEFTCVIYGLRNEKSINKARSKLFEKNFSRQEEIIDLSLLPPCQSVLFLHYKRANYVSKLWRSLFICKTNRHSSLAMVGMTTEALYGSINCFLMKFKNFHWMKNLTFLKTLNVTLSPQMKKIDLFYVTIST